MDKYVLRQMIRIIFTVPFVALDICLIVFSGKRQYDEPESMTVGIPRGDMSLP